MTTQEIIDDELADSADIEPWSPINKSLAKKEKSELEKQEEHELIRKAQEGDIEARNKLVQDNLESVKIIANKIMEKYPKVTKDYLISEGYLALIESIDKFDLNQNVLLRTYASQRITWKMIDYIKKEYPDNEELSYNDMEENIPGDFSVEEHIESKIDREEESKVIRQNFTPVQIDIMKRRIDGKESWEEIGEKYEVTGEQIRQIEAKLLKKYPNLLKER